MDKKGGNFTDKYFEFKNDELSFHYSRDLKPDPAGFKMHNHEYCELYCFFGGKGAFIIEGNRYPLKSGSILIMRPSEAHAIEIDTSEPYERMSLHFMPSTFLSLDPELKLLDIFFSRELGKGNLFLPHDFSSPLCSEAISSLKERRQNERLHILSSLFIILNELSVAFKKRASEPSEPLRVDSQIISYINQNLSSNLSLDLLCSTFYISKPQLCRIFKAATGSTVWEYITVKRLMAAQQQIKNGVAPTKAALSCGFNDYSVFYRAYKRRFNTSPKDI